MRTSTTGPAIYRPNFYRDACSICGTHVPARAGFYVGKLPSGQYDIRCADHRDAQHGSTSGRGGSRGNSAGGSRPSISRDAMTTALALYHRSLANGEHAAADIARDLVLACAFTLGEPAPDLTPPARPFAAEADSLVADLLGSSTSADDGSEPVLDDDDREAAANLSDCEAAFADAPSSAPSVSTMRANRDEQRRSDASKPRRTSKPKANPFAHRVKQ